MALTLGNTDPPKSAYENIAEAYVYFMGATKSHISILDSYRPLVDVKKQFEHSNNVILASLQQEREQKVETHVHTYDLRPRPRVEKIKYDYKSIFANLTPRSKKDAYIGFMQDANSPLTETELTDYYQQCDRAARDDIDAADMENMKANLKAELEQRKQAEHPTKKAKAKAKTETETDPDYRLPPLDREIGIFLEFYLCINLPCPICGGELWKYSNPSQPVIDLYCSNEEKPHAVKFFQVKARNKDSTYKYFDIPNNYISVGSYRFGVLVHSIKPSDLIDNEKTDSALYRSKDALIGYICIEFTFNEEKYNITIDRNKSYIIIPNTLLVISPDTLPADDWYYKYDIDTKTELPNFKNPVIVFNPNTTQYATFNSHYRNFKSKPNLGNPIFLGIQFDETIQEVKIYSYPPVPFPGLDTSSKNKYLKYKNKYIKLRDSINQMKI